MAASQKSRRGVGGSGSEARYNAGDAIDAPGGPPDCWPVVSARTMRALDSHSIEVLGVPGDLLMESAGRAVAQTVLERLPRGCRVEDADGGEVCVVCGGGNNGGDGLVTARHLTLLGVRVRIVLLAEPDRLRGDAAQNLSRAVALGVRVDGADWRAPDRGVLVDAIFGTGLSRPVSGEAAASIRRINDARGPERVVIAVDLPSGLDADTGQVLGTAVEADATLTIGLPKLGLVLEPGRSCAGEVWVARIGIADSAPGAPTDAEVWSPLAAGRALPARPRAGHKGRFGHVLVVAASEGKTGAAALAASGAVRAGAGLVTVACPAGLNDILEVKCTEAMTVPVTDTEDRSLAAAAEDAVLALAADRDVVAMGPGVGRSAETVTLMRALAKRLECPLVVDADALHAFSDEPGALRSHRGATILTPHPGEAAALLGRSPSAINEDRVGAARELAAITGAVVLLKGAASVIAEPADLGGRVVVNPTGGPVLATGGTGDVLTGILAGLLAQGSSPLCVAAAGAYLHGAAADLWTEENGAAGLMASELADRLPAAAARLRARAARDRNDSDSSLGLALPFPGA